MHIFKQYYSMRTLCKTSNSLYTVLFCMKVANCTLNRHDL